MSTGPDGHEDDELLLELEPDPSGPTADASLGGEGGATAPAFDEAAAEDAPADVRLYRSEAGRADATTGRRAALLLEVARLHESVLGDDEAALAAAREAFAADPSFIAALWPLRRLLSRRRHAEELVGVYDAALENARLSSDDRADLLVERGRVQEDRLGRDADAVVAYEGALAVAPDHGPALLALFLLAARTGERDAQHAALAGLARRAVTSARAVALWAALARALRETDPPRALGIIVDAVEARASDAPLQPLLAELDALSRTARSPAVRAEALEAMARYLLELAPPFVTALLRESARLRRDALDDPAGALEALENAARLSPGHALVAAELVDLAERLERFDVLARAVARFEASPDRDPERALALALRHVEALGRAGRVPEALALLGGSPVLVRSAGQPAVFALRTALLSQARDADGLAEAFAAEGARTGGAAGARALVFAGAIRQGWAADGAGAEELYRRAVSAAPAERSAWDALEGLLTMQDRWADLAELLEAALAEVAGAADAVEREIYLREELIAVYRDDLGAPARALAHGKRLVALAPGDVRRRVRQRDLELAGGIDASDAAEAMTEETDTLLALADEAGDPAVTAALRIEAARLLSRVADEPARRDVARRLLREALADDVTGLAAAGLELLLDDPGERAQAVADELAELVGRAPRETVRALRFRLAHHQAAAGRYAEAIAALTPLRVEGDTLARAWSWDLARRSNDAILEVAILSDEADSGSSALGSAGEIWLALGEARERAGDAPGAGAAFASAMAETPLADAALGLLRLAAAEPVGSPVKMRAALRAVAAACGDAPLIARSAEREEALLRVASGVIEPADLVAEAPAQASTVERAELGMLRWTAGVTRGDAAAVAEALVDLATAPTAAGGASADVPLLMRAAARARLAGGDRGEAVHRRLWRASHAPELAVSLADLPVAPGAAWPADRPDPRRARATRIGGALGLTLDLEAALDAERRGALGAALAGYARVIAVEPERLEAWEGIRRVARAGDDPVGEARALARLGALVSTPALAATFFGEAARIFESVDRPAEAMALWGHALEVSPDDTAAFERVHALLLADLDAPGRPAALERVLSRQLSAATLSPAARLARLRERALLRLDRLDDAPGAIQDFKRILKLAPQDVESLGYLSTLASRMGDPASAAPWFERLISLSRDGELIAQARLELAACYEATRERTRAIETLRRASAQRPSDALPMERLVELYLRLGEWRGAVETLRDWELRQSDARVRAALQLRIGALLRDLGQDPTGAALAFRRAAELDPLGEGAHALVDLHDAQSDGTGSTQTIEREIAQLQQALGRDPLDPARLSRLAEFLSALQARTPSPAAGQALEAVAQVRSLLEPADAAAPPARGAPRPIAPKTGGTFWAQLAYPGSLGFLAEIWPHLVESAEALFPSRASGVPPRSRRVSPADEPRLSWVHATAAASGMGALRFYLSPALTDADPAVIIHEPEAAVVLGAATLEPSAATRFHVGRVLGLLRARAEVLERVDAAALGSLFACAASVVGAAPPADLPRPDEATLRAVNKAMSRRDRKALMLHASRFGFETIDAARFSLAVKRTADRLGLLMSGDVAAAARAAALTDPERWRQTVQRAASRLGAMLESEGAPAQAPEGEGAVTPLEAVRGSDRALDLLRFALSEAYPRLRREAGGGEP